MNGSGGAGPLSRLLCVTETSERLDEHLEHEPLDQCRKTSRVREYPCGQTKMTLGEGAGHLKLITREGNPIPGPGLLLLATGAVARSKEKVEHKNAEAARGCR